MKKSKKFICGSILLIFILCFLFSLKTYLSLYTFKANNVKRHIEYLSCDKFKGRLPGTIENRLAAQYIKSQFEESKLEPVDNNYFQTLKIKYPKEIPSSEPYLNIVNKNNDVVKKFNYNKDFKEDMLNFKKNSVLFNGVNSIITHNGIKAQSGNDSFIFYCTSGNELKFRSSFDVDAPSNMYIMITKNTLNEIKKYIDKGDSVSCYIPYEIKDASVVNVLGKISGSNPKLPPIVVSAHFDHVGTDLAGTVYNGALDNASGTSFVIEMSKYIKSLGKPKRDIIFVGFNGEEFGFLGSTAFAKKYSSYLKDGKVFNFDMVGGKKSAPLCIMGSKKDTKNNPFVNSISTVCSNEKIYFNSLFEDSSDHKPFRDLNIDAVTFCDYDLSKIHTPQDKSNFIEDDSINRCFRVSSKEIIKYSFGNNPFITNHKIIMVISLSGILIVLFYYSREIKKTHSTHENK